MATKSTSGDSRAKAASGKGPRRAATPGPVTAPTPPPEVQIDTTSVPSSGAAAPRTRRTRSTSTGTAAAGGTSATTSRRKDNATSAVTTTSKVRPRAEQTAAHARSAGERLAATATPAHPGSGHSAGHGSPVGHAHAPGPVGASITLPFIDVTVSVPHGAHLHAGPVQIDLGPRTLAVAGAAGVVAAGVVEWPFAVAALGAGLIVRRLRRRG